MYVGESVFLPIIDRKKLDGGRLVAAMSIIWMMSTRSDACRHLSMMEYAIDRSVLRRKDFQPM